MCVGGVMGGWVEGVLGCASIKLRAVPVRRFL